MSINTNSLARHNATSAISCERVYQTTNQLGYAVTPWCLCVVCLLGMAANGLILLSRPYLRAPSGATLSFTYSLSACDLWIATCFAVSLVTHSILKVSTCHGGLILQALRLGALVSELLHLVMLSVAHYLITAYPVRAKRLLNQYSWHLIIFIMALPTVMFLSLFAVHADGMRGCDMGPTIINAHWFRMSLVVLVGVLLLVVIAVYTKLLLTLKRSHDLIHRRQTASASALRQAALSVSVPSSLNVASKRRDRSAVTFIRKRYRTVATAMLIVGTFLLGWLPMTVVFALTCNRCAFPRNELKCKLPRFFFTLNAVCYLLGIIKLILNPLIYACRIPDIQRALERLCRLNDSETAAYERSSTGAEHSMSGEMMLRAN